MEWSEVVRILIGLDWNAFVLLDWIRLILSGSELVRLDWIALKWSEWSGVDWIGLEWFRIGLVWLGLLSIGLDELDCF